MLMISFKDRAFHRELHMGAELARQAAQKLRAQVNAEYASIATHRTQGPSPTLIVECMNAEDLAQVLLQREHALVQRVLS